LERGVAGVREFNLKPVFLQGHLQMRGYLAFVFHYKNSKGCGHGCEKTNEIQGARYFFTAFSFRSMINAIAGAAASG